VGDAVTSLLRSGRRLPTRPVEQPAEPAAIGGQSGTQPQHRYRCTKLPRAPIRPPLAFLGRTCSSLKPDRSPTTNSTHAAATKTTLDHNAAPQRPAVTGLENIGLVAQVSLRAPLPQSLIATASQRTQHHPSTPGGGHLWQVLASHVLALASALTRPYAAVGIATRARARGFEGAGAPDTEYRDRMTMPVAIAPRPNGISAVFDCQAGSSLNDASVGCSGSTVATLGAPRPPVRLFSPLA
jgi:hypothetical protein